MSYIKNLPNNLSLSNCYHLLLIFIILFFIIYGINIFLSKEKFQNGTMMMQTQIEGGNENVIPKIIHQTAPKDQKKWRPEWEPCQKSWKTNFPEPEYVHWMWYDEDLDDFIKTYYPWFYDTYTSYDEKIKRIDMARYFILHKYGGIYADMDYECLKNFYNDLVQDKVNISESPYKGWEHVQNALMASPPNKQFWMDVVNNSKGKESLEVLKATGPTLLSDTYFQNTDLVNILPVDLYNPQKDTEAFDKEDVVARHFGTISWLGKNKN